MDVLNQVEGAVYIDILDSEYIQKNYDSNFTIKEYMNKSALIFKINDTKAALCTTNPLFSYLLRSFFKENPFNVYVQRLIERIK